MSTAKASGKKPKVVSPADWLAARKELLKKEKELSRLRDEVSRQRLELPWEKVEKEYVFEGPTGKETLADLFGGRSQLLVYHFMLGPGWKEGCQSCSFLSDHTDGAIAHLAARGVSLVVVSRAPLNQIEVFKKRMGWKFKWVSSNVNEFNYDYHVSFRKDAAKDGKVLYNYAVQEFWEEELPGMSAFYRDSAGQVFHTYSSYGRGLDLLIGAYNWLDLAPLGRNEGGLEYPMAWVRHHDRYVEAQPGDSCCSHDE